ncbi:hypothetical protein HAX54_025901, partial [Datura stramonium]|nr:hypothetical protein [Datura stramonium]
ASSAFSDWVVVVVSMVLASTSATSPTGAWKLGPAPTIRAMMSCMEHWIATSTCLSSYIFFVMRSFSSSS